MTCKIDIEYGGLQYEVIQEKKEKWLEDEFLSVESLSKLFSRWIIHFMKNDEMWRNLPSTEKCICSKHKTVIKCGMIIIQDQYAIW